MKLKITGIYRIINIITHMSYIGQSENIWARWGREELASRCTSDPFHNSLLCQAIREYGVNNFECEVRLSNISIGLYNCWTISVILLSHSNVIVWIGLEVIVAPEVKSDKLIWAL